MASKTEMIRARIEPQLKNKVDVIFETLGLSTTEAISLFYKQVLFHQGLPFEVKIPNNETIRTFAKTDKGEELAEYKDMDDMFDKLGL